MRTPVIIGLSLLTALSGCMLPRPYAAATYEGTCKADAEVLPGDAILFATLRLPDCRTAPTKFTKLRGSKLSYGSVTEQHDFAQIDEESWFKALDRIAPDGKPPILLIHGYHNSNDAALERSFGLRTLTGGSRAVVALTWPSYDVGTKYVWDEANNEWALPQARAFIVKLAKRHKGLRIIAHSMGNRTVLDLLQSPEMKSLEPGAIGSIVLASPDIDRETLRAYLDRSDRPAIPITIYASTRDQALSASWRTHGYPRAGDMSGWVSGHRPYYAYHRRNAVTVVDTSMAHAGITGHAAFIESREGAADLCRLLTAPETVTRGRSEVTAWPGYWRLTGKPVGDDCEGNAGAAIATVKRLKKHW